MRVHGHCGTLCTTYYMFMFTHICSKCAIALASFMSAIAECQLRAHPLRRLSQRVAGRSPANHHQLPFRRPFSHTCRRLCIAIGGARSPTADVEDDIRLLWLQLQVRLRLRCVWRIGLRCAHLMCHDSLLLRYIVGSGLQHLPRHLQLLEHPSRQTWCKLQLRLRGMRHPVLLRA